MNNINVCPDAYRQRKNEHTPQVETNHPILRGLGTLALKAVALADRLWGKVSNYYQHVKLNSQQEAAMGTGFDVLGDHLHDNASEFPRHLTPIRVDRQVLKADGLGLKIDAATYVSRNRDNSMRATIAPAIGAHMIAAPELCTPDPIDKAVHKFGKNIDEAVQKFDGQMDAVIADLLAERPPLAPEAITWTDYDTAEFRAYAAAHQPETVAQ